MGQLFDLCVQFLLWLGRMTGTTYVEINIIIFCILEPIVFLVMAYIIYNQWRKIKELKR